MSIESEVLRGGTYGVGATRDCISTKRGRVPSRAGMITVPDSLLFLQIKTFWKHQEHRQDQFHAFQKYRFH